MKAADSGSVAGRLPFVAFGVGILESESRWNMYEANEGRNEGEGVAWLKARCGQGREAEGAGKPWSRLPSLARLLSMPA